MDCDSTLEALLVVHLAIVMIMSIAVGLVVSTECLEHVEQFGRKHMAWTPWPRGVFYFDRIPREMNWPMFWTFWTGGIVVSFLASLVPAARAARTDPVTTLRYQ